MAQKNRGILWGVLTVLVLLFVWWLGNLHGWWSSSNGSNSAGTHPGTTSVNNFYTTVQSGESKQQVDAASQNNNLTRTCTITVNTSLLTREVCVYSSVSGNGTTTVTYENGKVTAVSKSGF